MMTVLTIIVKTIALENAAGQLMEYLVFFHSSSEEKSLALVFLEKEENIHGVQPKLILMGSLFLVNGGIVTRLWDSAR